MCPIFLGSKDGNGRVIMHGSAIGVFYNKLFGQDWVGTLATSICGPCLSFFPLVKFWLSDPKNKRKFRFWLVIIPWPSNVSPTHLDIFMTSRWISHVGRIQILVLSLLGESCNGTTKHLSISIVLISLVLNFSQAFTYSEFY